MNTREKRLRRSPAVLALVGLMIHFPQIVLTLPNLVFR
jgi:hypothetical protein